MISIDAGTRIRFEEAKASRREMLEDGPVGAKDAAKTFYWGDEDVVFADAIRLELVASLTEGENPGLAAMFRSEAAERKAFLRNPYGFLTYGEEEETCYCGGETNEVGRCLECGDWIENW